MESRDTEPDCRATVVGRCELEVLRATDDELVMVLQVDGRDVPVHVPIDTATRRALQRVHALYGHHPSCRAPAPAGPDLLRRALRAAGARPSCLLVRPGSSPAFWLRIATRHELVELDLGVVDAVAILLAGGVPIVLTDTDHDPWQEAIDQLLPPDRHA